MGTGFAEIDWAALLLAVLLGGAVGLEREWHGRPAGLRTHILVCLSSTLLISVSRVVAESVELGGEGSLVFDPNRMGAGIVTGIGFLGAATVLRSGDYVRGLTTAACIWFVAGLGIVLGTSHYTLGVTATAIVLVVLIPINWIASAIKPHIYRRLVVGAHREDVEPLVAEIRTILDEEDLRVMEIASSRTEDGKTELVFYVSLKNELQAPRLVQRVAGLQGVTNTRWRMIA